MTTSQRPGTPTSGPISAPIGHGPEQIAGSLAEFVGALRNGDTPSGEAHSNVLSLCMVEAAIRSATEGRRVSIAAQLEDAYHEAVSVPQRPEVAAALASGRRFTQSSGTRLAPLRAQC